MKLLKLLTVRYAFVCYMLNVCVLDCFDIWFYDVILDKVVLETTL
jgi:hypothetical protein